MLAEDRNHDLTHGVKPKEHSSLSPLSPLKSYDREEWMHSRGAREIRILCEYMEVRDRLQAHELYCTFTILGSARVLSREAWTKKMSDAESKLAALSDATEIAAAQRDLQRIKKLEWACEYYDKIRDLSAKLSEWALTAEARHAISELMRELPCAAMQRSEEACEDLSKPSPLAICCGGGPGIMEAASEGSHMVEGSRSVGMGISLPFETGVNKFVDKDLAFSFHYFFTRKFWMVYSAIGVVVAPGGYGTLDELFEFLTLKQTGKLKRDIPVVLLGVQFWKETIDLDRLADLGLISEYDIKNLLFTDDIDEAFEYLRSAIVSGKLILGEKHIHKSMRK